MGVPGGNSSPAEKLARLMARDLGVNVDPKALRLFIIARWACVSALAHDIHDNAEKTDG